MSRPLRLEFEGGFYHITSRGDRKEIIYESDADRRGFISLLASVCKTFNWSCHAYCLMDNHYHLLVETPEANLSRGMRQLNGVYTQQSNRRHKRCGHVFQGRYHSVVVDKESYLLELTRYVVLNPVRAGKVRGAQEWPWSSYRAMIGLAKKPEWLQVDWLLSAFGSSKSSAIHEFEKFVADGIDTPSVWKDLRQQIYLGDDNFVEKMQHLIDRNTDLSEIPRTQARPQPQPLDEFLRLERDRDRAIARAYQSGGYTLKEIAAFFDLHYSTISRIARNSKIKT